MNEDLAARYQEALHDTIGYEARMITFSKSQYLKQFPECVPIFNANLCVESGKIWHGDLDLTVDENALATLARRIGDTIFVLYESDGRFDREDDPLVVQAVYSVTASGHTKWDYRYIERAADGTLRMRPSPPRSRTRLRLRLLWHRPRLLRFWVVERKSKTSEAIRGMKSMLIYIGARDGGETPLLVLGLTRGKRFGTLAFEFTFYPSDGLERSASREMIKLAPEAKLGRLHLWANVIAWPGRNYSFRMGYQIKPRWR